MKLSRRSILSLFAGLAGVPLIGNFARASQPNNRPASTPVKNNLMFQSTAYAFVQEDASIKLENFLGSPVQNRDLANRVDQALNTLQPTGEVTEEQAFAIGVLAYIYSFSIFEVERSLYTYTHLLVKNQPTYFGEWNRLWASRRLYTPEDKAVVSPNNDTLYGSAAINLSEEPVLLYTPNVGDRYRVWQIMDAHANSFAYIGSRATGGREAVYAFVAPGWRGALPAGVVRIQAPTHHLWIAGRILVETPEDVSTARDIYARSTLAPMSRFQKEAGNNLDIPYPNQTETLPNLEGLSYFEFVNQALNANPPGADENALMTLLARIGYGPGLNFQAKTLPPSVQKGLEAAIPVAKEEILARTKQMGETVNGWDIARQDWGTYGKNYIQRAAVALEQLATNIPSEAMYWSGRVDRSKEPLNGKNRYVLRFESNQIPPVRFFWSMTMYDLPNYLMVENAIERYAIGDRTPGLQYKPDGSLEIYLQHDSPGTEKESNWLPAPNSPFYVLFRMYGPKEEAINGTYQLPPIQRSAI